MSTTKRKSKQNLSTAFTLIAGLFLIGTSPPPAAHAAGLLVADGGLGGILEIEEHDVHVTLNNGIAVTKVTQIFRNTENRIVEALYTFPVPQGASVSNFSMWIGGKEMMGEVVEKERARRIYNSYKPQKRDPGLLEQTDYKTFEMRIFPIAAGARQKVEVTYYQELEIDHDYATYVYPLATVTRPDIDSRTRGKFAMNVELHSMVPIASVQSPSHEDDFIFVNHTPEYTQASLETNGGDLSRDVVLGFQLSRPVTGIDMVTSNTRNDDGYFYLTLTAGEDLKAQDQGMDYVFILDVSGSMAHDGKLRLSRNSIHAFIETLSPDDRFDVMAFNVSAQAMFQELQPATESNLEQSEKFLREQRARGGTVLRPALEAAYRYGDPDRPLNVILLSDGMTEQQERRTLIQMIQSRPDNARVFCIGVGNEVNRPLLEQLAQESGGLAAFASQGDNFERQAKAFRRKLTHPAISDLRIELTGAGAYDILPEKCPNLFHGSPVRIYGRYAKNGKATLKVRGNIQGQDYSRDVEIDLPSLEPDNPEIERMWAWHKVDGLLKQADKKGNRASVMDEIIRLGEGYSIVTEYTSFLVLENDGEYKRWKIERRNALRTERDRKAQKKHRQKLDTLRRQADIGPGAAAKELAPIVKQPQNNPTRVQRPITNRSPRPAPRTQKSKRSIDLGIGSGPVTPLFLGWGVYLWYRKRKAN